MPPCGRPCCVRHRTTLRRVFFAFGPEHQHSDSESRASPKIRSATCLSCSAVADLAVPSTSRNAVFKWQRYTTARRAFPHCRRCTVAGVKLAAGEMTRILWSSATVLAGTNQKIINKRWREKQGGAAPSYCVIIHPSSLFLPLFPCLRGRVEGCNPTC